MECILISLLRDFKSFGLDSCGIQWEMKKNNIFKKRSKEWIEDSELNSMGKAVSVKKDLIRIQEQTEGMCD